MPTSFARNFRLMPVAITSLWLQEQITRELSVVIYPLFDAFRVLLRLRPTLFQIFRTACFLLQTRRHVSRPYLMLWPLILGQVECGDRLLSISNPDRSLLSSQPSGNKVDSAPDAPPSPDACMHAFGFEREHRKRASVRAV